MVLNSRWGEARKYADEHGGGGKWIKFVNDGDTAQVAITDGPTVVESYWSGGKRIDAHSAEAEPLRASGERLRTTYEFKVLDLAGSEPRPRILSLGTVAFKVLHEVARDFPTDKYSYKITRRGAKGDTKTTYIIVPGRELTADERRAVLDAEQSPSDPF